MAAMGMEEYCASIGCANMAPCMEHKLIDLSEHIQLYNAKMQQNLKAVSTAINYIPLAQLVGEYAGYQLLNSAEVNNYFRREQSHIIQLHGMRMEVNLGPAISRDKVFVQPYLRVGLAKVSIRGSIILTADQIWEWVVLQDERHLPQEAREPPKEHQKATKGRTPAKQSPIGEAYRIVCGRLREQIGIW